MIIKEYSQINIVDDLSLIKLSEEIEGELEPIFLKKYNDKEMEHCLFLIHQMSYVLFAASRELKGKTILDLGCGSNDFDIEGEGMRKHRGLEPWLCRALLELGAIPIGIDIGDLSKENFEHYQLDLLKPNALSFFKDNSVDIANAHELLSSPYLSRAYQGEGSAGEALKRILIPQLERIVKPEGYFIYSDEGHQ